MNEDNFLKKFRSVSTVFKEKQKGIIFLTKEYYLSYYLGNVTTCKKMNYFLVNLNKLTVTDQASSNY